MPTPPPASTPPSMPTPSPIQPIRHACTSTTQRARTPQPVISSAPHPRHPSGPTTPKPLDTHPSNRVPDPLRYPERSPEVHAQPPTGCALHARFIFPTKSCHTTLGDNSCFCGLYLTAALVLARSSQVNAPRESECVNREFDCLFAGWVFWELAGAQRRVRQTAIRPLANPL